ncbi:hypothetical protein [Sphingobium sp. Ant17]|uniref:hypothetical protein n=1 Tax=Sphingobium sp. Ant17 TaxID=1461752 RepID=UPI0005BE50E6|nr:hypothetical protein [Sphingobium sp. Ant17]
MPRAEIADFQLGLGLRDCNIGIRRVAPRVPTRLSRAVAAASNQRPSKGTPDCRPTASILSRSTRCANTASATTD